jgi:hypothetical protein
MAFLAGLRRVAGHLLGSRGSAASSGAEAHGTAGAEAFGFSSLPGEESLGSMSAEELAAWENRDVPSIDRGEEIEIEMTVAGLLPTGHYGLRYDMVVEGVTWFEFQGSPCARRSLEVIS